MRTTGTTEKTNSRGRSSPASPYKAENPYRRGKPTAHHTKFWKTAGVLFAQYGVYDYAMNGGESYAGGRRYLRETSGGNYGQMGAGIMRSWDEKIRQICDLGDGITVWIIPLHEYPGPDFKRTRKGEAIGIFKGDKLVSGVTNYDNTINGRIFRYAMHDARYYKRNGVQV